MASDEAPANVPGRLSGTILPIATLAVEITPRQLGQGLSNLKEDAVLGRHGGLPLRFWCGACRGNPLWLP